MYFDLETTEKKELVNFFLYLHRFMNLMFFLWENYVQFIP